MTQSRALGGELSLGPAADFMRSLWQLNHALEKVSRGMARSIGVTAQQRTIIRCIGRYPGMTASQLAEQFHLDAGTVSSALNRLERRGLLKRRRGHRDRRRVSLGLTAAGRAVDGATTGTVEQAVDALLNAESPLDVAATRRVLGALTDLLEHARGVAVPQDGGVAVNAVAAPVWPG